MTSRACQVNDVIESGKGTFIDGKHTSNIRIFYDQFDHKTKLQRKINEAASV
jgi:hypothetical protein